MIKHLLLSLLLALPTLCCAQSFATLWKQYRAASDKDQPVTALAALHAIERKAAASGSYGDLLAALLREMGTQREVSPDSVSACRQRLDTWSKTTGGVVATLCRTALGGRPDLDSLLAAPDASVYTAAQKATEYAPFIATDTDSRYFHHDLLHVIAAQTGQRTAAYRYYAAQSDRPAAAIAAALMAAEPGFRGDIDTLIARYADLPECGALALRKAERMSDTALRMAWIDEAMRRWPTWRERPALDNMRQMLTAPQFRARTSTDVAHSQQTVWLHFYDVRNITTLNVTLTSDRGDRRTLTKSFAPHPDYATFADSLDLGTLSLGRWTIAVATPQGLKSDPQTIAVTNLMVLTQRMPTGKTRYIVVDALTGHPVAGASLRLSDTQTRATIITATTDSRGEYVHNTKKNNVRVYASKGTDTAYPAESQWTNCHTGAVPPLARHLNVYTDRAIYRPGHTVRVAVVRHNVVDGLTQSVVAGEPIRLRLTDAEGQQVADTTVATDDFGTASAAIVLPAGHRAGRYSLRATGKENATGYATVRVEEYVRPTFDITIATPTVPYAAGDTIAVGGRATAYSGAAVAGAQVAYTVRRTPQWWWRRTQSETLLTDTVTTDADGSFTLRMPMLLPEGRNRFYRITAEANITDIAGESHAQSLSLPLSDRQSILTTTLPDRVITDTVPHFVVSRVNAAGAPLAGAVAVVIDGQPAPNAQAGQRYTMPQWVKYGRHDITFTCGSDTLRRTFTAFGRHADKPVEYTHDWCYLSQTKFGDEPVWLQYGSSDSDVRVYYAIYSGQQILETGQDTISASLRTRAFTYRAEYGDGITISLAWVKDTRLYTHTLTIARPLADKTLRIHWRTFRDKTTPGNREEWTLDVAQPDGTPARAAVMAVLYDKSLDAIAPLTWDFSDPRRLALTTTQWFTPHRGQSWLAAFTTLRPAKYAELRFDAIAPDCIYQPYLRLARYKEMKAFGAPMLMARSTAVAYDAAIAEGVTEDRALNSAPALNDTQVPAPEGIRSNFAETAYFAPALLTDAAGHATLRFTLPESVTTWRALALAHDRDMRYGTATAECVAQKPVMIQARMPRFLRQGDRATIAATIANLTAGSRTVNATLTLLDAKTERPIGKPIYNKVSVAAGATAAATFDIPAQAVDGHDALLCRFTAGDDSEQHLLAVLAAEETITKTESYVFLDRTDTVLTLTAPVAGAHMRVEYVDNPATLMYDALPDIAEPSDGNAISLATALYAASVANTLGKGYDAARLSNLRATTLARLRGMQLPSGAFPWWNGMAASQYITLSVAKTLARMNDICGSDAEATAVLNRALDYLQQEMDREVSAMKARRQTTVGPTALDWLYTLALTGRSGGTAARYLRTHLDPAHSDIAQKAVAAIVLYKSGDRAQARQTAESIRQHTVYRRDIGRYFDTYRAPMSWCDYRIPTQTLAIEALTLITPDNPAIAQMQRWLLASKHTQRWDNDVNTVNAVHAFLLGAGAARAATLAPPPVLADTTLATGRTLTVPVHKSSRGESWAAAYITYQQRATETAALANGLAITRQIIADRPTMGDRVTVRLTIDADRDYDFVTIADNRAATLEPVQQTSGYRNGYYCEPRDQKTLFHFDRMPKGRHTIDTQYYIARTGTYTTGTATALCAYATEYRATSPAVEIAVTE